MSQHPGDLAQYPTDLTAAEAWCWVAHCMEQARQRVEENAVTKPDLFSGILRRERARFSCARCGNVVMREAPAFTRTITVSTFAMYDRCGPCGETTMHNMLGLPGGVLLREVRRS